MGLPGIFRKWEYSVFNYMPRYYNPRKEELEQRKKQIETEMGIESNETYTPKIRKGQMGNMFRRKRKQQERASNLRLIALIVFLIMVAWLIFFR